MAARSTTGLGPVKNRSLAGAIARVCLLLALPCAMVQAQSGECADVTSREKAVEDLDFLVRQLREKHPNPFGRIPEAQFEQEVARRKDGLAEQVDIRKFSLSLAALLAMVGDDHTRHRNMGPYYGHINGGGKVFPVKPRYRDGQMTVEAWSPQVLPSRMGVGDVILSVNGERMESLVKRYGRYMSLETDLQRCWAMEWWFPQYQVLLGDARDAYRFELCDAQGQVYEETLPAAPPWLEQYENLKRLGPTFHYEFYHDGKTCLFHIGNFYWDARQEYECTAGELLAAMRQKNTQYLILDLRANGGGNSGLGMSLLRHVIDREYAEDLKPASEGRWPVKLVVLCDRSTYSAASWLAMVVKDCKVGIVAGEETGGRASFFGDIVHVSLPNTGLTCGIGTGFFMRRAGYDDKRGVLPDLPLDVTLPDRRLVDDISAFLRQRETQSAD